MTARRLKPRPVRNRQQADTTEVEPVPLTRRQMRKLRRQQEQQEPFLPWLR